MIGSIKKMFRNIAAKKGKNEFEKRMIKATFTGDSKEPKEKHVIYLLGCLRGDYSDVSPQFTITKLLDRLVKNLNYWSLNTKMYIIFHRGLRDYTTTEIVAQELSKKQHQLYSFQKKGGKSGNMEEKMHSLITGNYSSYIKNLVAFVRKCRILFVKPSEIQRECEKLNLRTNIWIFQHLLILSSDIFKILRDQAYCKKNRLFTKVIELTFNDLLQIYVIMTVVFLSLFDRLQEMSPSTIIKLAQMYKKFVIFNSEMKIECQTMRTLYNYSFIEPQYLSNAEEFQEEMIKLVEEKKKEDSYKGRPSSPSSESLNSAEKQTASSSIGQVSLDWRQALVKKARPLHEIGALHQRPEISSQRKIEEDEETSRQSGQSKAPAPIFNMEDVLAKGESQRFSELSQKVRGSVQDDHFTPLPDLLDLNYSDGEREPPSRHSLKSYQSANFELPTREGMAMRQTLVGQNMHNPFG